MARDIGGMFKQMARRAPGGRRLDRRRRGDPGDAAGRGDAPSRPAPARATRSRGRRVGEALQDALGRRRARGAAERAPSRRRSGGASGRSGGRSPEGTVVVEYSPDMHDGDPDPGEVVWTRVPFEEDPTQGKDRPVVVIGRRGRTLVGVPLTTKRNDREAQISVGSGAWDRKRRTSYARIWRMLDLEPEQTRREGAVLPRADFDRLIATVDDYYDVRRERIPAAAPPDDDY